MSVLRVNEAIARAQTNGKAVNKKTLANLMWPDSSEKTQQVNISNLSNGRRNAVQIDFVKIICEHLDCTPNYLFGFDESEKTESNEHQD